MGNVDISLFKGDDGIYDFEIENGDFKTNDSYITSIQMSLLIDQRASASEMPVAELRRGWWGDVTNRVIDHKSGSKLWLLEQARITTETVNFAIDYVQDALQWLIDDGHADKVEVDGAFSDQGIRIDYKIFHPNDKVTREFFELWENTKAATVI